MLFYDSKIELPAFYPIQRVMRTRETKLISKRIDKIMNSCEGEAIDALLVTKPANVRYLSGFQGNEASLFLTKQRFLITDFRYGLQARKEVKGFEIKLINGSFFELIGDLAKTFKTKRLGFEYKHLSYGEHEHIKKHLSGIDFIPTFDVVEKFRQIKDAYEIKLIKDSIGISNKAINHFKSILKPRSTENDLAAEMEHFIKSMSGERSSFEVMVASGTNSALPHARPSVRKVQSNDMVLLDLGANYKGYNSDLTRIFFLGKIKARNKKIYDIVKEAQRRSVRAIRPGADIAKVDGVARDFIRRNGFGKSFGHALGHGIGLEVHESPAISHKNHAILKPGMVFTVEPAIYLPNWGGIRIEDMVLVTRNGHEVLTDDIYK